MASPSERIWHVYPNFGRKHITDQRGACWCQPEIDVNEDGAIVIHEVEH